MSIRNVHQRKAIKKVAGGVTIARARVYKSGRGEEASAAGRQGGVPRTPQQEGNREFFPIPPEEKHNESRGRPCEGEEKEGNRLRRWRTIFGPATTTTTKTRGGESENGKGNSKPRSSVVRGELNKPRRGTQEKRLKKFLTSPGAKTIFFVPPFAAVPFSKVAIAHCNKSALSLSLS